MINEERKAELERLLNDGGKRVQEFFDNAPGSDDDDLEQVVEKARFEAAVRYNPSLGELFEGTQ